MSETRHIGPSADGWSVRRTPTGPVVSVFDTRDHAVQRASQVIARHGGGVIYVTELTGVMVSLKIASDGGPHKDRGPSRSKAPNPPAAMIDDRPGSDEDSLHLPAQPTRRDVLQSNPPALQASEGVTVEHIDRWLVWLPVIALFFAPLLAGWVSPGLLEQSGSFWEAYIATFAWSGGATVVAFMIKRGMHDSFHWAVTASVVIVAFLVSSYIAAEIGTTPLALDEAGPQYTGQGPKGLALNFLIWIALGGWNAFGPLGLALATFVGAWAGIQLAKTRLFQTGP